MGRRAPRRLPEARSHYAEQLVVDLGQSLGSCSGRLQAGNAIVVDGFDLPPLRFNLAGARPVIAEFKGLCDTMLDQPPLNEEQQTTEQRSRGAGL